MELQIEKLVYGGDGLARLPADAQGRGKTVFLPFVIPGEQVDASVVESRSGFARAKLEKVLTPSPDRVAPPCPYFGKCGGCQYQHIDYPAQLRFKSEILRETLRRTAKLELDQEITGARVGAVELPQSHSRPRCSMIRHLRWATSKPTRISCWRSRAARSVRRSLTRRSSAVWALGRALKVPASAARHAVLRQS